MIYKIKKYDTICFTILELVLKKKMKVKKIYGCRKDYIFPFLI